MREAHGNGMMRLACGYRRSKVDDMRRFVIVMWVTVIGIPADRRGSATVVVVDDTGNSEHTLHLLP